MSKLCKGTNVQENDIVFTVGIPYKHMRYWYDLKQDGKLAEQSYVQILNAFILQHAWHQDQSRL